MKAQWLAIWTDLKSWASTHPVIVCMICAGIVVFAMGVWTGSR